MAEKIALLLSCSKPFSNKVNLLNHPACPAGQRREFLPQDLKEIEHSKGWRDEIIGLLAVSYARTGNYGSASEWMNKLYFNEEKDKTRLAIINLLLQEKAVPTAEALLDDFEHPRNLLNALLAIAGNTGKKEYYERALVMARSTEEADFDNINALLYVLEVLNRTEISE